MFRCLILATCAVGSLHLLALSAIAAPYYNVTDLGTLGGISSTGRAINELGEVVGWSQNKSGKDQGFFWSPITKTMTGIPYLPGIDVARANDINESSQVVGSSGPSDAGNPFLWQKSASIQDLGSPFGATKATATGINDSTVVAGHRIEPGPRQSFEWTNGGGYSSLGTGNALAINSAGVILGHEVFDVWTWYGGTRTTVTALIGEFAAPYDINDLGQISGAKLDGGFFLDGSTLVTLPGFSVDLGTYGFGLNNMGVVVGESPVAGPEGRHGFIWEGSGLILDLNDFISINDPLYGKVTILTAEDINDRGQIVGTGLFTDSGQMQAVLLSPVPEPGTLTLFGIGVACLGITVRRRRNRLSSSRTF